jgi:hypothetical protein
MTDTADELFFERYGNVYFDVFEQQFSVEDLSHIFFPDTMTKLNFWITAGYIKPLAYKDPRGGRDRRRFSIIEISRIAIIDSLVHSVGLRPSHAVQIANFCLPFLNDTFDRDAAHELKSTSKLYVRSWLDRASGKMKSRVFYRKHGEHQFYADDPDLNPDAQPRVVSSGVAIELPLTAFFNQVFLTCAKYLAARGRGGMDKFRRPANAA